MTTQWLGALSEAELLGALPPPVAADIRDLEASGYDTQAIAAIFAAEPEAHLGVRATSAWAADLWRRMQHELRLLICTDDPKYADLRTSIGREGNVTATLILSSISGAVGATLGVTAGLATPFVALLLLALVRTTKEAWCAQLAAAAAGTPPDDPTP